MFKRGGKITLILLIFLLVLTSCSTEQRINDKSLDEIENKIEDMVLENINQYSIDVVMYPEDKLIKGGQKVTYINNENEPMEKIYFHLYPNAFKERETAPFLFDDFLNAYPTGFAEGYINIEEVKVDGADGIYSIGEFGETIMEVSLLQKLDIGERVDIDIKYTIKLPPAAERFGYGSDTYNLGNWYPVIAVHDDSGWNLDPYYAIGDPFYADVGNYKVNIKAPKEFTIASTGNILSNIVDDNTIEWTAEASAVRDFAWVASKSFEIVEKEVDGILLKMYFLESEVKNDYIRGKALEFAEDSLKAFNRVFGKYPYKEYSVVQTNFPSGMEYPGIVFIGSQYYDKYYADFLETVIVHETAHQWWYGVIGNDQIDESWLDESLASYSEVIYQLENYGEEAAKEYQKTENEDKYYKAVDSLEDKAVLKSLKDFNEWNEYGALVYSKGAIFLDDIKTTYGKDTFYKILKTYYNRYKFKNATTEDFLDVCEEITGEDLDEYFDKWLK